MSIFSLPAKKGFKLWLLVLGAALWFTGWTSNARAQTVATVTASSATYAPAGGSIKLTVTLRYSGAMAAMGLSIALPDHWSYASTAGSPMPGVVPQTGDQGEIGYAYFSIPASPATFTTTVNYPAGMTGNQTLANIVALFRPMDGTGTQQTASVPDIVLAPSSPTIAAAPVIATQPLSQAVATGGTLTLSVNAPQATAYQWSFNGAAIAGATGPSLSIQNLATNQAGSYAVTASNAYGRTTSSAATVAVPTTAWLTNLSARAAVQSGAANSLVAGFVTVGNGNKSILLRGDGPSLGAAPFNLPGILANPALTLFSGSTAIAGTTGWSSSLAELFLSLGAFALPVGSHDTALLQTIGPGAYSAQIASSDGGGGVALAEIYDADSSAPSNRLINLSARAMVGAGIATLAEGFVIAGSTSETVLIRGVGPALGQAPFNLPGVLSKVTLTLFNAGGAIVASNSGWSVAPTVGPAGGELAVQSATAALMQGVGAFSLSAGSADAALVVTLPPGIYTAQISGIGSASGMALAEIYEVR